MGFINFRGGQKTDRFDELSAEAKKIEIAEQEKAGSKRRRAIAADYFGVSEWADKENSAVLALLAIKARNLNDIHNSLLANNHLARQYDDSQLYYDFWLASITSILNQGIIDDNQKIKCTQLLLTAFQIHGNTTPKEHYIFIAKNPAYKDYFQRCFEQADGKMPVIWLWMEHLGNQLLPGTGRHGSNRMETTVHFVQEYVSFMMGLSFYLSQAFPGKGCGRDTNDKLTGILDSINDMMTRNEYSTLDFTELQNPIYSTESDIEKEYKGFEQNRSQAEGLKGVFASIRNRFGKRNRVLQLIRLLDDCSESETGLLENEYKRLTRGI